MKYHWSDKNKLNKDNEYLTELYEKYIIYLTKTLNKFHGVKKEDKYWRIIIGPWLRYFIDIVFDRYETLKKNKKFKYQKISFTKERNLLFRSKNFESFFKASKTDEWNKNLFNLIKGFEINKEFNFKKTENKFKTFKIKDVLIKIYIFTINPLTRLINRKILIIDPYLNYRSLLKLTLGTKILPYFTKSRNFKGKYIWHKFVKNITYLKYESDFEEILNTLIFIYLPSIYTDYFYNFKNQVLNDLKNLPEIVFTSIGYHSNEEFKIIAAETSAKKGKVLIGQHGGNIGIGLLNQDENHQIKISNKFYTYGWTLTNNEITTPMPSMQLSSFGNVKPLKSGQIINIMPNPPMYFYAMRSMPLGPEYLEYLNLQIELSSHLKKEVSNKLLHRLNGDSFGWNAAKLLQEKGLKTSDSSIPLKKELSKCALCINSYNGTSALQTLSINFPTILFWPENIFELRRESSSYIDNLIEAKIFHTNPKTAGQHLNKIINNIDDWWNNQSVQKARKLFVSQYALSSKNWVKVWKDELLNQLK